MKGRHALHIILLMLWPFLCMQPEPAVHAAPAMLELAMGGPAEEQEPAALEAAAAKDTAAAAPQQPAQNAPAADAAQATAARAHVPADTTAAAQTPPADSAGPQATGTASAGQTPPENFDQTGTADTAGAADAQKTPADSANTPTATIIPADSANAAAPQQPAQHAPATDTAQATAGRANAPADTTAAAQTPPADSAGPQAAGTASAGQTPPEHTGKTGAADAQKTPAGRTNTPAATAAKAEPASPAGRDGESPFRLFGTVEFRGKLQSVPRWLDALRRNTAAPLFTDETVKLSATQTWKSFKESLRKLKPLPQLKAVNSFWNQWPYRTDPEVYGKPDYWATPREFRSKSGDCEDFCIAKYFTLKEVGWRTEDMRIVVVMETIRRIGHAVLAVRLDGKIYILDVLSKNVLEHSVVRNYVPQFSVNEQYKWMHMQPNKK